MMSLMMISVSSNQHYGYVFKHERVRRHTNFFDRNSNDLKEQQPNNNIQEETPSMVDESENDDSDISVATNDNLSDLPDGYYYVNEYPDKE
jgi:hypothetical protein